MTTVWIFLVLTQNHMIEVGKFTTQEVCENTRKEVIIQRAAIGYGFANETMKPYIMSRYFETTQCFQVWK